MVADLLKKILILLTASIITLFTVIVIMVHDPVVLEYVEKEIGRQAGDMLLCSFCSSIKHIDIAQGRILLGDVIVVPRGAQTWSWSCDTIAFDFSWRAFFLQQKIVVTVTCGDTRIATRFIDRKIAITEYLLPLSQQKSNFMAVVIEKVHLPYVQGTFIFDDQESITLRCAGAIELIDGKRYSTFTIMQDLCNYRGNTVCKDLTCGVKFVDGNCEIKGSVLVRSGLRNYCPVKVAGSYSPQESSITAITYDEKIACTLSYNSNEYHAVIKTPWAKCVARSKGDGIIASSLSFLDHADMVFNITHDSGPETYNFKIADLDNHFLDIAIDHNGALQVTGATDFFYARASTLFPAYEHYFNFLKHGSPCTLQISRGPTMWGCGVYLSGLQLRLPYTYNFIRSARAFAAYDPLQQALFVQEVQIKTDRGKMVSGLTTWLFDTENNLNYAHVPLIIQDFFVHKTKDFMGTLSGSCTIDYHKNGRSSLAAVCSIHKCHIRNNPFSGQIASDIIFATLTPLAHHDLFKQTDLDVRILSHEPIDIKTPFLQATAHVDMHIAGTANVPELSGHIELIGGSFNFPYAPLHITSGKVFFVDSQKDDPSLEICASASIKNYLVTVYVEGTVSNPVITFQSTPSLQEEQIIGLLFGGSPDSSLSLVMPLSSVASIEKLIVGSATESASAFNALKKWLGSFEKVKIIPRFSDQTGRGGIKGALAIEVNDNLSALIQQNFNLSEDTYIEVAYKPLDELTVRGMRDERGDFGGELEARFTW